MVRRVGVGRRKGLRPANAGAYGNADTNADAHSDTNASADSDTYRRANSADAIAASAHGNVNTNAGAHCDGCTAHGDAGTYYDAGAAGCDGNADADTGGVRGPGGRLRLAVAAVADSGPDSGRHRRRPRPAASGVSMGRLGGWRVAFFFRGRCRGNPCGCPGS